MIRRCLVFALGCVPLSAALSPAAESKPDWDGLIVWVAQDGRLISVEKDGTVLDIRITEKTVIEGTAKYRFFEGQMVEIWMDRQVQYTAAKVRVKPTIGRPAECASGNPPP